VHESFFARLRNCFVVAELEDGVLGCPDSGLWLYRLDSLDGHFNSHSLPLERFCLKRMPSAFICDFQAGRLLGYDLQQLHSWEGNDPVVLGEYKGELNEKTILKQKFPCGCDSLCTSRALPPGCRRQNDQVPDAIVQTSSGK